MTGYQRLSVVIESVENLMELLLISGMEGIREHTVRELEEAAEECERYGLALGSSLLSGLARELEAKRHTTDYQLQKAVKLYCNINTYILTIKHKLQLEKVKETMKNGKGEDHNAI